MFGYWKRQALSNEDECKRLTQRNDDLFDEVIYRRTQAKGHVAEITALQDDLRRAKADLDAVKLQLAAEQQDNARLQSRLNTTRAGLDHATRCYEQGEAERKAAVAERDEWRETAERSSSLVKRIGSAFAAFYDQINLAERTTDARTDHADASDPADPFAACAEGCTTACRRNPSCFTGPQAVHVYDPGPDAA